MLVGLPLELWVSVVWQNGDFLETCLLLERVCAGHGRKRGCHFLNAAKQLHLSPVLKAATNSSGGVMSKMISPQNVTTGVSTSTLVGKEGLIVARVFKHSIFLAVLLGLLVMAQQYLIPWIIPH